MVLRLQAAETGRWTVGCYLAIAAHMPDPRALCISKGNQDRSIYHWTIELGFIRYLHKMETRPVGRASIWCYFELVNGSTANSERYRDSNCP